MKNFFLLIFLLIPFLSIAQNGEEGIFYDSANNEYIIRYRYAPNEDLREAIYIPADLVKPSINVTIDPDSAEGKLNYKYKVLNTSSSKQRLYSFEIKTVPFIDDLKKPGRSWIVNFIGWKGVVRWSEVEGTKVGIPIGEEKDGFSFLSSNPPKIGEGYASGLSSLILPNRKFDEGPRGSIATKLDSLKSARKRVKFNTLSPSSPFDPFSHLNFLDSLRNYIPQAQNLEWLGNASFSTQLSDKLQQVRSELVVGDSTQAAATLTDFIQVVEYTNEGKGPVGASLTPEGYALLYYNAQYLLDRLPEPLPEQPGSGIACGCDNPVEQSSGTIAVRNGETRCLSQEFSGSVFFESGGVLNVCSTATFQNIYGNAPGAINISESGDVTVGNWNNNYTEDAIENWGTLEFTNWTTVNQGSLTNHGQLSVGGGLNQNNGAIVNHGELSVNNAVNLNQPGNINTGTWSTDGTLTLNSNAEFENECRVEAAGQLMVNGTYTGGSGSYTSAGQQVTVNSGGVVNLSGGDAMLSADRLMLNGAINVSGERNLLSLANQFQYNSGASVTAASAPLNVCSANVDGLPGDFDITNGCAVVIPVSPCNPEGFNAN